MSSNRLTEILILNSNDPNEKNKLERLLAAGTLKLMQEVRQNLSSRTYSPGVHAFVLKGFVGITGKEFIDVHDEFISNEEYAPLIKYYENKANDFGKAYESLGSYLTNFKNDLEVDSVRKDLYQAADLLYKNITVEKDVVTFKNMDDLTQICRLTEKGLHNPYDAKNAADYDQLYKKVNGQKRTSESLKGALKIVAGVLSLMAAYILLLVSFSCPVFILPTIGFALLGGLAIASGAKDLDKDKVEANNHKYPQAANMMSLFHYRLQHKKDNVEVRRLQPTFS